ncbi:MAG: hypothetical protein EA376_06315 [Phycisphaeraceae bacterium]|nr:MAG: hypothetical protein EA376_06315 [Phycisphaeraceae bacterium]
MSRSILAIVAATGLATAAANAGEIPVLIIVDNTDPSSVTFNSTGAAAAVTDDSASIVGGISLLDLFGGAGFNTGGSQVIGGDLSPNGNTNAYNRVFNDIGALGTSGLNFWASGIGGGPQTFNTTDPAFTGATTGFDFSAATFNLSGDIVIGDTAGIPGSGAVLGSWVLIPTPGAVGLFAMAGLAASRRRRA